MVALLAIQVELKLANGKRKFATNETLKLKYPVLVSQKGLLDSPRKCQFLKNVPVWNLGINYSQERRQNPSGMIWKFSEVNWKIHCTDMKTCIPDWLKITETLSTWKNLMNYCISYQSILNDLKQNPLTELPRE